MSLRRETHIRVYDLDDNLLSSEQIDQDATLKAENERLREALVNAEIWLSSAGRMLTAIADIDPTKDRQEMATRTLGRAVLLRAALASTPTGDET